MKAVLALAVLLVGTTPGADADPRYLVPRESVPTYVNDQGTIGMTVLLDQASVGSDVGLSLGTFLPGAAIPDHTHPGAAEILYVLSGEIEVTIAGTVVTGKEGSAVYIPPDAVHSARVVDAIQPARVVQVYSPGGAEQRFKAWTAH